MLVQKHREYKKDKEHGCFAVGKSREEIFNDLKIYCINHKDKSVYYYVHPIRPSKENLRPEYMMEIAIINVDGFYLMPFWTQAQ